LLFSKSPSLLRIYPYLQWSRPYMLGLISTRTFEMFLFIALFNVSEPINPLTQWIQVSKVVHVTRARMPLVSQLLRELPVWATGHWRSLSGWNDNCNTMFEVFM
jgi:hypothetical protein